MWILPSRGRAQNAARFFSAFAATGGSTPGVLCVDSDDQQLEAYRELALPKGWALEVAPRLGVGPTINRAFNEHPAEPWYGTMSDDAMPVTGGWDKELADAAGEEYISYCADGINDERQASHFAIGGALARRLGWIILPGLVRIYGDNVISDIGRAHGLLRYLPHVRLEHWHFSNGKALIDETYLKPEAGNDSTVYQRWVAAGRPH